MTIRQFGVAALALLGRVSADSCCFVIQDEAHEVYWSETAAETYTSNVYLTSVTTLVTPYPTTTITNYETNVYLTEKVFTTTFVITENPVALYTNAVNAIAQQTEILDGSSTIVTGGVTMASPTGFWVYYTAKIFTAPAVTNAVGNVACGTMSSFTSVATESVASACIPTFTGVNSNAAAYFSGAVVPGVEITLTTPFIHVPTRAALPSVGASQVCAQGNGTENYGYPVQELINHLAANPYYVAQYPGIENCIPGGPQIHAVANLVADVTATIGSLSLGVAANPPSLSVAAGSVTGTVGGGDPTGTETPGGNLTSSTTMTVTATGTNSTVPVTSPPVTSSSSSAGSAIPTSITPTSSSSTPTALPESSFSSSTSTTGGETPISGGGGLLPTTSSSTPNSSSSSPASTPSSSSSSSSISTSTASVITSTPASSSTIPTALSEISSSSSSVASAAPTTSSTAVTSASIAAQTSAVSSSTESIVGASTLIPVGTTAVGSAAASSSEILTSPSTLSITPGSSIIPITASFSIKQYVPWELLAGLMGVVAFAFW